MMRRTETPAFYLAEAYSALEMLSGYLEGIQGPTSAKIARLLFEATDDLESAWVAIGYDEPREDLPGCILSRCSDMAHRGRFVSLLREPREPRRSPND
jgi:hypothetical protein